MDFLNKAYLQFADLFRSMTPAARITAALLLAVIVVGLAFLFRFQSISTDDYLLGGRPFQGGELVAVQSALSAAELKNWEIEGNRIKIPSGQKDLYIAALAENNALPADWNMPMEKAMQATNPFRSRHEIDLSMRHAKQKQLELVISRFRNVEQASVMFDEADKDRFRNLKLKTASVAVQTTGLGLEEDQARSIRNLLATSYAGLERNNIAITDTTTGRTFATPTVNGEAGENSYASAKSWYDSDWKRKIQSGLAMIPGVVVEVNAEINPKIQSDLKSLKIDSKPIPISTSESETESTSTGPSQQGRPGAVPNGVDALGGRVGMTPQEVAAVPGPKSTLTEKKSQQNNAVGQEQSTSSVHPLVPERVRATIGVPVSYYTKVWRQTNPPVAGQPPKEPDAAELKKIETQVKDNIKDTVVNLLPSPPLANDPYPLVTVTTYTDIAVEPPEAEKLSNKATSWLASNWRTVGMFLMGLVGLVMLRSMLRSQPSLEPTPAHTSALHEHSHNEPAPESDQAAEPILVMRRKLNAKGPNLREELRQLVKEDPDSAANVLRGWIGDAA